MLYPSPRNVYTAKQKISAAKFRDLMDLVDRGIIPSVYRQEYEALQPSESKRDCLDESDFQESEED